MNRLERRFYVYFHYRNDKPCYVGEGCGRRAWIERPYEIHEIKIMMEHLTKDESIELEKLCIAEIGLENLENKNSSAGWGTAGIKRPDLAQSNKDRVKDPNYVNPMRGRKHSKETKDKIRSKIIGCVRARTQRCMDGEGNEFDTVKEAAIYHKIPYQTASSRVNRNINNWKKIN